MAGTKKYKLTPTHQRVIWKTVRTSRGLRSKQVAIVGTEVHAYIFYLVSLILDSRIQICSPVMHPITSGPILDPSPCQMTLVWTLTTMFPNIFCNLLAQYTIW